MLDLIANIILPAAAVGSTPLAANGYNSSADAAPPPVNHSANTSAPTKTACLTVFADPLLMKHSFHIKLLPLQLKHRLEIFSLHPR